jgi:hypothetical protein
MKHPRYPVKTSDDYQMYRFFSEGPRGRISKGVIYSLIEYPDARIFAEGSTSGRTRLYQMGIADNLLEINEKFEVEGF